MKSKVFKYLVLASALAFMNCGDDSSTAPTDDPNSEVTSSAATEVPPAEITSSAATEVPPTEITSSATAEVPPAEITSSATAEVPPAEITSSATAEVPPTEVTSSASTEVPPTATSSATEEKKPESSSSEKKIESSSSEKKVESSSSAEVKKGIFLADNTDEDKEPMQVEYIEHTGHDGGGILSYPKQLSKDQKHGIVVWGPGGGTEPGAYGGMIHRLASHGFVVIALRESPGDASQAIPALNWLEKKNNDPNDPLYQKLDMNTVGCSGHSMGGLESEQAVIKDKRVKTAMLNNSGDLGHTAMSQVGTDKTIGIVYGEAGMERPNAEADYNNPGVKAPACLIQMTGGPKGGEGGYGHGSGPWDGISATVAWMRWHLGGEDNRKADFVGSSGKYINGPIIGHQGNWKGTCKNF